MAYQKQKIFHTIYLPIVDNAGYFLFCLLCLSFKTVLTIIPQYNIPFLYPAFFCWISIAFLYSYIFVTLTHITKTRLCRYIILSCVTTLSVIQLFLKTNFNQWTSPMALQPLFETDKSEAIGFLQTFIISKGTLIAVLFGISLLILYLLLKTKLLVYCKSLIIKLRAFVISMVLIGFSFFIYQSCTLLKCNDSIQVEFWSHSRAIYAMDNLSATVYSLYSLSINSKQVQNSINHSVELLNKTPNCFIEYPKPIVVLIIGESFIKYHSNLYGYHLKTNPKLSQRNPVVFNNAFSPYNLTSEVLKNFFSLNRISNGEHWFEHPIFPVLMKKAGYSIYFWDNQYNKSGAESDFNLNYLLHNKQISRLIYTKTNDKQFKYDGMLIDDFFKNYKQQDNLFAIFHLKGQHMPAKDKYPALFEKEQSLVSVNDIVCNNTWITEAKKRTISEYDNATLYNDNVIEKVIKFFENKNAAVLYFSDHGDEVYDYRDRYGREFNVINDSIFKYQYEIPLFVWFSNKYKKQFPQTVANINKIKDSLISTDDIGDLVLSLANINVVNLSSNHNPYSIDYSEKSKYAIINNRKTYISQ